MNKKKISLIATSLLIVGGVMTTIGLMCGGFNSVIASKDGLKIYDKDSIVNETKELESFKDISIDMDFGNIEIVKSDKYAIEIQYNSVSDDVDYSVENGKLIVKNNKGSIGFNIGFNFGFTLGGNRAKIYVPQDAKLENVVINSKAGDIKVDGIDMVTSKIDCDFGRVEVRNINANQMEIESKSGDVNLNNIKAEKLTMSVDFGDIDANGLVTNGIVVNAKSGEVDLDGELKGNNVIDCDFGDINVNTSLAQTDYSYNLDMDFGSSKINGKKSDGGIEITNNGVENRFDINCKSGDLEIRTSK